MQPHTNNSISVPTLVTSKPVMHISKLKFFSKSVVQGHSFFVPYYCSFHYLCCMAASSAQLYSNLCESDSTHLITFNYNVPQLIWGFGNGYCLTHKTVCCVSLHKMLLIKKHRFSFNQTGDQTMVSSSNILQWIYVPPPLSHAHAYFSEFMPPSLAYTHTHTHTQSRAQ
jgi:hypothetical protein